MISLVDLTRSFDAPGAQSAATPASISSPLPAGKPSAEKTDTTSSPGDVSISAEGVRQLQRATEVEAEQAAAIRAASGDAELAARMAHEMAYRREVIIIPASAYSNLANSLYVSGTSPANNAASMAKAQSALEQARMARIALYEMEKAKGTPPAEIYSRLLDFKTVQPTGYRISIAA